MKSKQACSGSATLALALVTVAVILLQSGCSLVGIRSAEEPNYLLLQNEDRFEVREYEPLLLAETLVDSNFDDAGNIAFKRLFGYITGDNEAASEIAMTAPVMALDENRSSGEKISMTAPVIILFWAVAAGKRPAHCPLRRPRRGHSRQRTDQGS